jgi:hypothetical protein
MTEWLVKKGIVADKQMANVLLGALGFGLIVGSGLIWYKNFEPQIKEKEELKEFIQSNPILDELSEEEKQNYIKSVGL